MTDRVRKNSPSPKQFEAGLQASQEKYRNVLEYSNDGIAIVEDSLIRYVNPPMEAILGFPREEMVGACFEKFIAPGKRAEIRERHLRRLKGEAEPSIYETTLIQKSGDFIEVEVNVVLAEFETRPAVLVFIRDITKRKGVERAWAESEARYRRLFNAVPLELFRSTPDGQQIDVNSAMMQMLEAEIVERQRTEVELRRIHEELITLHAVTSAISQSHKLQHILQLTLEIVLVIVEPAAGYIQIFDGDRTALSLVAQSGFAQETIDALQATLSPSTPSQSGQQIAPGQLRQVVEQTGWHHLVSLPLTSKKTILGYMEIFNRDVREVEMEQTQLLRVISRQLAMAIENDRMVKDAAEARIIQEVDRLRSELIGNVSHELKTPLNLIKAASTTLLAEDVEFEQDIQQTLLRGIDEETDRLAHLVNNLLDLPRMEQNRLILDRYPTDIGQLVQTVIQTMQVQLPANLQVVFHLPTQPLFAEIDAKRIEQVLRNILSNAIKYSPDGGTITVQGRRDEGEVVIQVDDQGIGIAATDLDKIFEQFYRVKNEATQHISGVGLGLAICRDLVEAHGGRIWVESTPGQGSAFYLSLPVEPED